MAHLVTHDIIVGLAGGLPLKGCGVVEQLVSDDPQRPPVAAYPVVGSPVQAGQHLGGDVLWSAHRQLRLNLGRGGMKGLASTN